MPPDFQEQMGDNAPVKSNLEIMMKNLTMTQTKQNNELKNRNYIITEILRKLTFKGDLIVIDNKMLETQISQMTHQ